MTEEQDKNPDECEMATDSPSDTFTASGTSTSDGRDSTDDHTEASDTSPITADVSGPVPPDEDADTNATEAYPCDLCGKVFDTHAERVDHMVDEHGESPDRVTSPPRDETSQPTGPPPRLIQMVASLLDSLPDKEPEQGYTGLLSTPLEWGVALFGLLIGSLLAQGHVSVEIVLGIGGLGFAAAETANQTRKRGSRDAVQSNLGHYVLGVLAGFLIVWLPAAYLPPGFDVWDFVRRSIGL